MITFTVTVPTPAPLITAGYTTLQLQKSTTQSQAGPYANVIGGSVTLDPATTSYTLLDVAGTLGDWYINVYTGGAGTVIAGQPSPGYFTLMTQATRDLLGITTLEASDTVMTEYSYFPAAIARARQRLPLIDTIIVNGGDLANLALTAVTHLLGALLCPKMIMAVMNSEHFKDYQYVRDRQLNWVETETNLLARYEILISQASSETSVNTALYPTPTILAGPTSSGIDTSAGLIPLENDILPYTTWVSRVEGGA